MTEDNNTQPSGVTGGMHGSVIGEPRALEADLEQLTTMLIALSQIAQRTDPLNPLRYVRKDGVEALRIHLADQLLTATIAAFKLAREDLEAKLGCFDENPECGA